MSTNAETTTTARDVLTVMRAAGRAGVATCLWGPPGVGKTSLVRALAAADDLPCTVVVGALKEPTEFGGLPMLSGDRYRSVAPDWAYSLAEAGHGWLLLDELNTAPPATQAAMLGVILEGRVGDLDLPRSVQIVAALNPAEQSAGGWDLTAPMANRLLHIDYAPTTEDWIAGSLSGFPLPAVGWVGEPNEVVTRVALGQIACFIRTRPHLLDACPDNPAQAGRAWPSRRSWTLAASVLALLAPDDESARHLALAGLVGEGAALEYMAWERTGDLPDPQTVIDDPDSVAWSDLDPSRTYAVLAAVVAYSTALGTADAWRAAWLPLEAATLAGSADVAALHARTLMAARPGKAKPPRAVRAFTTILTDAGLMGGDL